MAQAKQGDQVKVNYTGKLDDGTVFDTTQERGPIEFTLGQGDVIPGFDQAVEGMEPGQSQTVKIPPEQAYGPFHEELVQEVPRTNIPDEVELEVGAQLRATGPDQQAFILTVTGLAGENVTLDANHPLAGKELTFDIELIGIG